MNENNDMAIDPEPVSFPPSTPPLQDPNLPTQNPVQPPLSNAPIDTANTFPIVLTPQTPPKKHKKIAIIIVASTVALMVAATIILLFFFLRNTEETLSCTKTTSVFGLQYEIKYDIVFEGENAKSLYMTVVHTDRSGLFPDLEDQLRQNITQINEEGGDVHLKKSDNSYTIEGSVPIELMIDDDRENPTELLTKVGLTAYLDEQAYVCTGPSMRDKEAEIAEKTDKIKNDIISYLKKKYGKNDFEITNIDSKDRTSCQYGSCEKVSPRITDYTARVHSDAQNTDFAVQVSSHSEDDKTTFQDSLLQNLTTKQFDTDVQKIVKEIYGSVENISYESAYYGGSGTSINDINLEDSFFPYYGLETEMENVQRTNISSAPFEFLKKHETGLNIEIQLDRSRLSREAELEKLTNFVLKLVDKGWFENHGFDIVVRFKEPETYDIFTSNTTAYAFMSSHHGDNRSKSFSMDKCVIDDDSGVTIRGPASIARREE